MKVLVEILKALGEVFARAFFFEQTRKKEKIQAEKDMEVFDEALANKNATGVRKSLDKLVRQPNKRANKG